MTLIDGWLEGGKRERKRITKTSRTIDLDPLAKHHSSSDPERHVRAAWGISSSEETTVQKVSDNSLAILH